MATAPPTFAIVTNFDDRYDVGFLCAAINAGYCSRWSHRFLPCVLSRDDMQIVCSGRHFAWAKVALFQWLFSPERCATSTSAVFERWLGEDGRRKLLNSVEYIVWIDGDAMVLNHAIPLAKFVVGAARSKAIVLAEDMASCDWLNTGVFFVRTDSEWASSIWSEAWENGHPRFHQAPFWDQSAICQTFARRREFAPDVLAAQPTGLRPSEAPWYSWQGGKLVKETSHLWIWDSACLQFANPLHAQFILHLCGFSSKLNLCRKLVQEGALKNLHPDDFSVLQAVPATVRNFETRWATSWSFVCGVVAAETPFPWGWPPLALSSSTVSSIEVLEPALAARYIENSSELSPIMIAAPVPSTWSIAHLRKYGGTIKVRVDDCEPPRATDPPRRGYARPSASVYLWQLCDYVCGYPPPVHPVLGKLDSARQWRAATWKPWCGGTIDLPAPWDVDSDPLSPVWSLASTVNRLNVLCSRSAMVRLVPPGATERLHCPYHSLAHHLLIWQLEGESEYLLFPPTSASIVTHHSSVPISFDASQSALDPWSTSYPEAVPVTMKAGQALLVPNGWWITSRSLSVSLDVRRSLIPKSLVADHMEQLQRFDAAEREFLYAAKHVGVSEPLFARVRDTSQPAWCKVVTSNGSAEAPKSAVFSAVAHIDVFRADGRGVRSTRLGPQPLPVTFFVGAGSLPGGESFEELLRSMTVGERAFAVLRDFPIGAELNIAALDIELLAFLPQLGEAAPTQDIIGNWSWFGDPDNWLGAPPGHEPVDQVAEARLRELTSSEAAPCGPRLLSSRRAWAKRRCFTGGASPSFAANSRCVCRAWRAPRRLQRVD